MGRKTQDAQPIGLSWLLLLSLCFSANAAAVRFDQSSVIALESRLFAEPPLHAGQQGRSSFSVSGEAAWHWIWNDGDDLIDFKPFVRIDSNDRERSHVDLRELAWTHAADDWEIRTGIRTVYWGVTEFQHLVDVINQSDLVESLDGEKKLGQPMLNLSLIRDWGTLDLYLLGGFRERTFPGKQGRLRPSIPIDTDHPIYESSRKQRHIDLAARWSHYLDIWDFGLSVFHGTNREPLFLPLIQQDASLTLTPWYGQITQIGLEVQATLDSWLWKLEAIHQNPRTGSNHLALQTGAEYTFVGISDSRADLGVLLEYGWDDRGEQQGVVFQNDLFLGIRLVLNDVDGSQLLAGVGVDLDGAGESLVVEASRRIGDDWKVSVDARWFLSASVDSPLFDLRDDDVVQIRLERFF